MEKWENIPGQDTQMKMMATREEKNAINKINSLR